MTSFVGHDKLACQCSSTQEQIQERTHETGGVEESASNEKPCAQPVPLPPQHCTGEIVLAALPDVQPTIAEQTQTSSDQHQLREYTS